MSNEQYNDNVLESFVEASNKEGFSLDISLLINGAIVTGTLVSASEYFKLQSKSFKNGNKVAKSFSEKFASASEAAEDNAPEPKFIHLKDTRIFLGEIPTPSVGDLLWRGKLSEVDSFFLGKISAPK